MESLVVPAISVTILRSSPIKALIKDDLPTLGRPTTAILGVSSSKISNCSFLNLETKKSNKSPVPLPDVAEIQ